MSQTPDATADANSPSPTQPAIACDTGEPILLAFVQDYGSSNRRAWIRLREKGAAYAADPVAPTSYAQRAFGVEPPAWTVVQAVTPVQATSRTTGVVLSGARLAERYVIETMGLTPDDLLGLRVWAQDLRAASMALAAETDPAPATPPASCCAGATQEGAPEGDVHTARVRRVFLPVDALNDVFRAWSRSQPTQRDRLTETLRAHLAAAVDRHEPASERESLHERVRTLERAMAEAARTARAAGIESASAPAAPTAEITPPESGLSTISTLVGLAVTLWPLWSMIEPVLSRWFGAGDTERPQAAGVPSRGRTLLPAAEGPGFAGKDPDGIRVFTAQTLHDGPTETGQLLRLRLPGLDPASLRLAEDTDGLLILGRGTDREGALRFRIRVPQLRLRAGYKVTLDPTESVLSIERPHELLAANTVTLIASGPEFPSAPGARSLD